MSRKQEIVVAGPPAKMAARTQGPEPEQRNRALHPSEHGPRREGLATRSRGKQAFKQGDVTRALKGAIKAGLDVHGLEIVADTGNIRLDLKPSDQQSAQKSGNEWDGVR